MQYSAIRDQQAIFWRACRRPSITASARHWELGAASGRHKIIYGLFESSGEPDRATCPRLTRGDCHRLGGEVGYRVGPNMRVGFVVARQDRHSTVDAIRGYRQDRRGHVAELRVLSRFDKREISVQRHSDCTRRVLSMRRIPASPDNRRVFGRRARERWPRNGLWRYPSRFAIS